MPRENDAGEPLASSATQLGSFARWLEAERGLRFGTYEELRRWSVTDLAGFWSAVQQHLEIPVSTNGAEVLVSSGVPGAQWFPGATTNYANGLLTGADDEPATITVAEDGSSRTLTRREFRRRIAALARSLRDLGVEPGDRVVGYLPNIAEAAIAFYASAAIGAVWSSVGQDYAPEAAVARLAQLNPAVLIATDGYRFGGVEHDRRDAVRQVSSALGDVRTVLVPHLGLPAPEQTRPWSEAVAGEGELDPVSVPFDHPLWVLFSSGTTGIPKGIVHSHGGIQLEMHKMLRLHWELGPGRRLFWATSPSWVVWNILVSAPLVGATAVLGDGSPTFPDAARLWRDVAEHRVTDVGTSPGLLAAGRRAGLEPGRRFDLSALRQIISTGAPLPAAASAWCADVVGGRVDLVSVSGGTDVVGAFAGGAATVPLRPGELSAGCLGVAVEAWDEQGRSVVGEVGELVVTRPMPSMPVRFWADPDGVRYRDAYFSTFPGVWRHGDWITITEHRSVIVHGRSDSTLNRNGIRMGSADIYHPVEAMPEIDEALVIGAELPSGGYWMPLFVVLGAATELDESLRERIREVIRRGASPRHVPDEIYAVPAVPHTRTGKKLEVPVKRILQGADPDTVVAASAIDDPRRLDFFVELARRREEG